MLSEKKNSLECNQNKRIVKLTGLSNERETRILKANKNPKIAIKQKRNILSRDEKGRIQKCYKTKQKKIIRQRMRINKPKVQQKGNKRKCNGKKTTKSKIKSHRRTKQKPKRC